jgi:hypothetical protein
MTEYAFRFDPRYARLLALVGVRPDRACVTVADGRLDARFGPWRCTTSLDNVAGVEITGPYSAVRVIGPHLSLKDRGLTFGTNLERGACVRFREPVPGIEPTGRLRHPGLTVTVADVDALATAVTDALRQSWNAF